MQLTRAQMYSMVGHQAATIQRIALGARKDGKLTDLIIPLSTAKYTSSPVEKLSIHAAIETTHELKSVYSPTHAVNVERPDNKPVVNNSFGHKISLCVDLASKRPVIS